MFSRLDTIPACDVQTAARQQRPLLSIASRGGKTAHCADASRGLSAMVELLMYYTPAQ